MIAEVGDIYYVDLSPVIGSEMGGIRPVVVIQNNIGNRYSPTLIVAAITSQTNRVKLPTHVEISANKYGLNRDSVILLEQIRTIDKKRIKDKISRLTDEDIKKVYKALLISVDPSIRSGKNNVSSNIDIDLDVSKYDYKNILESMSNDINSLSDMITNIDLIIRPLVEKQKIARGKLTEQATIEYFNNNDYIAKKADNEYDALKIDVIAKNDKSKIFIQVKAGQISMKEITKLVENVYKLNKSHDEGLRRVVCACADTFPPNSDIVRRRLEEEFKIPIMYIHKYQVLKICPEYKSTVS